MRASDYFEEDQREELRRKCVSFWAAAKVPALEIAKRLEISIDDLVTQYFEELMNGPAEWTSTEVAKLYRRMQDGDADSALLWLCAADMDPKFMDILRAELG